jgi:hypothetical protein
MVALLVLFCTHHHPSVVLALQLCPFDLEAIATSSFGYLISQKDTTSGCRYFEVKLFVANLMIKNLVTDLGGIVGSDLITYNNRSFECPVNGHIHTINFDHIICMT